MYYLYKKTREGNQERFVLAQEEHLFGCNVGLIPDLLRRALTSDATEPYKWHIEFVRLVGWVRLGPATKQRAARAEPFS